jgi:class 3 adenylate cyclase
MARRLAVILAADVVDYTAMMEEDEDAAIALIRDLRETSLEPVALAQGGEVLKRMGDGWIIAFPSAGAALDCAMAAQTGLADHPKLRLRMGVHMGDIVEDEQDFYGAGVNLAARLQTEAPPGGVMISAELHRQLSGKQAEAFTDAGNFKLKNIAQPVNGFQWRPAGVAAGARADQVPVISVEAFAAAPDEGETRSAADDLREQIILALSRRTGVRVRDSAQGKDRSATYALRARLRESGGRGRFNLSLLVNADGATTWAGAFDGDTTDLFAFCDNAAAWADIQLRTRINALDGERIAHLPDSALSSSELRSRAAMLFNLARIRSYKHSRELMDRALRLNPDDPMAMAMRVEAIMFLSMVRHRNLDAGELAQLVSDLDRAVEVSPGSDYIFFVRGVLRAYVLRDPDGALSDARRCRKLNPGYVLIHEVEGAAHLRAGRAKDAAAAFRRLVELSPTDAYTPYRSYFLAVAQFCDGENVAAAATTRDLIEVKPSVRAYRELLARALRGLGDDEGAAREEAAAARLSSEQNFNSPRPPLPDDLSWLADALAPTAP